MEGATLESIMIEDLESYSRHKGALKKARSLFHHKKFIDRYKELQLMPGQEEIIDIISEEPDDRAVIWIYGPQGGEGKSTFGKHLVAKYGAFMFNGGRNEDIIFAYDYERIVIMDEARCQDIRYDIVEHFKDSVLFNQKYESHVMYLTPVHVIVMANVMPDVSRISVDRILLKEI
ncbi:uncharacterized protein LOC131224977 [Magnolia sinica]|uniref:uncharacterized protein LOC131224977 n=1 Tax=Magnolia sinica TaxID=86752 RepID=UPI0026595D8D|nr:uncharacterized protein LOC131224977 [Magnolia sinica]